MTDINERVAKAMGWTLVDRNDHDGPCWLHQGGKVTRNGVRDYRTDHASIPEMLAWLQERAWKLELTWECVEDDDPASWTAWLAPSSKPQKFATLNEAIANLVIAVAEAKSRG